MNNQMVLDALDVFFENSFVTTMHRFQLSIDDIRKIHKRGNRADSKIDYFTSKTLSKNASSRPRDKFAALSVPDAVRFATLFDLFFDLVRSRSCSASIQVVLRCITMFCFNRFDEGNFVRVEQTLGRNVEIPSTIEFIEIVASMIDVATGRDGFAITMANRVERSKPIIAYDDELSLFNNCNYDISFRNYFEEMRRQRHAAVEMRDKYMSKEMIEHAIELATMLLNVVTDILVLQYCDALTREDRDRISLCGRGPARLSYRVRCQSEAVTSRHEQKRGDVPFDV